MPSQVQCSYSDGKAQEEAVEWDATDYSRAGQVRVTGHVQGRTVEALVDVGSVWNKSFQSSNKSHREQI